MPGSLPLGFRPLRAGSRKRRDSQQSAFVDSFLLFPALSRLPRKVTQPYLDVSRERALRIKDLPIPRIHRSRL